MSENGMVLAPFDRDKFCDACGFGYASTHGRRAMYRYCRGYCTVVNNSGAYTDVMTLGGTQTPHFHRTCQRCGFEWLTELGRENEETA